MGKKILVVDDSATMRQQVSQCLQGAGFEVMQARDGMEGKQMIDGNADLAMVICDVNMPRMNGLEMIEQVQRTSNRPNLPIVMLTTEGQADMVKRAKAAGAKGWIVKPFKPDMLVNAAKKLTGS